MKNKFLSLLFLMHSLTSYSKEFDCSSKDAYQVPVSGYLQSQNPKLPKTLFSIVNPDPTQETTYLKAIDIGKYRFVKNNASNLGWDIYRMNATSKRFEKFTNYDGPLKVFENESVVVIIQSRDRLIVRRPSEIYDLQKELSIHAQDEKIAVHSLNPKAFVNYSIEKCKKSKSGSAPSGRGTVNEDDLSKAKR
jgi:hypothetical protein